MAEWHAVTAPVPPDTPLAPPLIDAGRFPRIGAAPILVVREPAPPGRPHAYDVVLDWIAENFPQYAPLFRVEDSAVRLDGECPLSLLIPWLRDPVQAWSEALYDQAMALTAAVR